MPDNLQVLTRSHRYRQGSGKLTHGAASSGAASPQRRMDVRAPARRPGGRPRLPLAGGSPGPPAPRQPAHFCRKAMTGLRAQFGYAPLSTYLTPGIPCNACQRTRCGPRCTLRVPRLSHRHAHTQRRPCKAMCAVLADATVGDSLAPFQAPGALATRPRATTGPSPSRSPSKPSQGSAMLPHLRHHPGEA